ncbi:MAG TPA: sulfatase [Candidatus Hydrogenedentes bacterium]|nr:sulfatase [Candidatus Hydrogenedentota bacterium]
MTRYTISRRTFFQQAAVGVCAAGIGKYAVGAPAKRPLNVLFICVDDLRPQLNCYGNRFMHTPNLDRLAGKGFVFDNHFASVPTCGASRCSLLTGMRPRTEQALTNEAFDALPREDTGKPGSLPELFRRNGYTTVSVGKVSHNPAGRRYAKPTARTDAAGRMVRSGPDDHEPELPNAWDRVYGPTGPWSDPWSAFFGYATGKTRSYTDAKTPAWEAAEVPDTGYPDGLTAEAAIQELNMLREGPFFLAVGFYKPHLPFCAPREYWEMYERAAIPLPDHSNPPENVDRSLSLHRNGELTGNYVALKSPEKATEEEMRLLRHGYFACVSYVDAQIGKVLDELERLGLRETTLVVVWGDHGFHLGDLYVWGKHTTFDFSLRSALLLSLPIIGEPGRHISDVVESADVYPTLADYCGLTPPEGLDGVSLRPALESGATLKKKGAYGYWRKGEHRAVTLRTPEYRLVEWKDGNGKVVQMELYDHQADPYETVNVAELHPDVVTMLRRQLPACFG